MNAVSSEIEDHLLDWCNRRLGTVPAVTAETDLLAEGFLDSLLVIDLVNSIEKHYGVTIDSDEISPRNFRTVRTLAALVNAHRANGASPSDGDNR